MSDVILSKTSRDGRAIEVRMLHSELSGPYLRITLDGAELRGFPTPQRLIKPVGDVTHFLEVTPAIGLTTVEAAQIDAALTAARQARDAAILATPEGQRAAWLARLTAERDDLALTYRCLIEEQADAFERAHAAEDMTAWDIKVGYEPQIAAAHAAVRAFDAANPEFMAHRRAERDAAAKRFAAID